MATALLYPWNTVSPPEPGTLCHIFADEYHDPNADSRDYVDRHTNIHALSGSKSDQHGDADPHSNVHTDTDERPGSPAHGDAQSHSSRHANLHPDPTIGPPCAGDCNGDGSVSYQEGVFVLLFDVQRLPSVPRMFPL